MDSDDSSGNDMEFLSDWVLPRSQTLPPPPIPARPMTKTGSVGNVHLKGCMQANPAVDSCPSSKMKTSTPPLYSPNPALGHFSLHPAPKPALHQPLHSSQPWLPPPLLPPRHSLSHNIGSGPCDRKTAASYFAPLVCPEPIGRQRLSEPLSLIDFEKKYSNLLPLQVEVLKGYRGPVPELSISAGDIYNIHFKQHRQVVIVQDDRGQTYSLPISSELKVGLLYSEPGKNGDHATFDKVSNILAQKTSPKLVCATNRWGKSDLKTSIIEGEVLVIRNKKRGALEVFSCTTNLMKVLPSSCKGCFTTDPFLTQLHLLEIIEYVPNAFPSKARIFLNISTEVGDIPRRLRLDTVSLLEQKTEVSLVASAVNADCDVSTDAPILFDIPLDPCFTELEVVVVEEAESQNHLYENTRRLFENFDITKLTTIKDTGSQRTHETQSLFYERLRGGCANLGVKLEEPKALYKGIDPPTREVTSAADPFHLNVASKSHSIAQKYKVIGSHESHAPTRVPSHHWSSISPIHTRTTQPIHVSNPQRVRNQLGAVPENVSLVPRPTLR